FLSLIGTMITYVAVPYQLYQLTRSSLAVGLLGSVELVPLVLAALFGGATADAMDRRKLLVLSELALAACSATLAVNALLPHPRAALLYVVAGVMAALNGFHRPALDAMTPRLVTHDELPAVAALSSVRGSIGMIAGPALGGFVIATLGMPWGYAIDALTFGVSMVALAMIRAMPPGETNAGMGMRAIVEGLRYAKSRGELIGTYVVDMIAMTFAMPMAL